MKSLLTAACVAIVLLQPVFAQRRTIRSRPTSPSSNGISRGLLISGRVVLSDGSPITEQALIQSICQGQKRTETHTDSHGSFSFEFGARSSASSDAGFDAEAPLDTRSTTRTVAGAMACDLQASLAGFKSDVIRMGTDFSSAENVQVGPIVLHRLENVEGFTLSATTAAAPSAARKALEKGRDRGRKGRWEEAEKLLEKAVDLYPKFAVAWFELGSVQLHLNRSSDALQAFRQSIAADSKYVNPYHGLMQIAFVGQNWQEVVAVSDKLLALDPVEFPDAWFANGVGYFHLNNLAGAEKSARRGLAIDGEHHVPRLEYLLALVLMGKNDYPEAALHFQAFLRRATTQTEIAEAQKQLDEVARISAARTRSDSLPK